MRPRKKDRHLPACIYQKHGAFYHVKGGKWTRLGTDIREVYRRYPRLVEKPATGSMAALINDVLEIARAKVKPTTHSQYTVAAGRIKEAFAEFTPEDVAPPHIYHFMEHHRGTPNMANRMRMLLKMAFDIAVARGQCPTNPVTSIQRFGEAKRGRYLTDEEYRRIRAAGGPVLQVIMDLAYLTGQRISDVLAIRLSDITEDGILFQQGKTGKRLCVRHSDALRKAVADAKALHGTATRIYLLGQRNGRLRSYRGVRDLFERARARSGVDDATLHDLRAKAITDAEREGKDAQKLGGHSTQAMTNRYLRDRKTDIVDGPSFRQW